MIKGRIGKKKLRKEDKTRRNTRFNRYHGKYIKETKR